jgi:hypothetical protein
MTGWWGCIVGDRRNGLASKRDAFFDLEWDLRGLCRDTNNNLGSPWHIQKIIRVTRRRRGTKGKKQLTALRAVCHVIEGHDTSGR